MNKPVSNIFLLILCISTLLIFGCNYLSPNTESKNVKSQTSNSNSETGETVNHTSKLNPEMKDFFDKYYVYYTGWDSIMRNDQNLGSVGGNTNLINDLSANTGNTQAQMKLLNQNDKLAKNIKIYPNGNYVIESSVQNAFSTNNDPIINKTNLLFNGKKYTKADYSNYLIDNGNLIYIDCMAEQFDSTINGNKCSEFGLFVNDTKIDETKGYIYLFKTNNNKVYYKKLEDFNTYRPSYHSYNVNTKQTEILDSITSNCEIKGFMDQKPVAVCFKFGETDTNLWAVVYIGNNLLDYMIKIPNPLWRAASLDNIGVINGHVYYTVLVENNDTNNTKVSLIKDNLKISEIDEYGRTAGLEPWINPIDGELDNCIIDHELGLPAYCIYGETVISQNKLGFSDSEIFINNEKIDFSPYFNNHHKDFYDYIVNTQQEVFDDNVGTINQVAIIEGGDSNSLKLVLEVLNPSNSKSNGGRSIYEADYLGNGKIGQPKLLINGAVGSLIGVTNK